jgi:amidohydrolase
MRPMQSCPARIARTSNVAAGAPAGRGMGATTARSNTHTRVEPTLVLLFLFLVIPPRQAPADPPKHEVRTYTIDPKTAKKLDSQIDAELPHWLDYYKTCHTHPELSLQEKESAARIAKVFREAGATVTENFGGYGVVAIIDNGPGPTILIRTDLDALPIIEETGLPFASKVKVTQPDGSTVGAMHACGHDMHQTVLAATATMLGKLRDDWSGKVILIAQPAEELGRGAVMMLDAGLFKKFGKPDACIALHVSHEIPTGTIGFTSGWVYANVDSIDITIHGRGGHGAYPHNAVDPIVTAAEVVLALQTIVSRRANPQDPSVITVGSFHAGTKHNIIPADAKLQLTIRSYKPENRKLLLDSIRQITTDVCKSAGCPKPPDVILLEDEFTPAAFNDPALTAAAADVFRTLLGKENVLQRPPSMGGEDFGQFALQSGSPGFMFNIGTVDPKIWEAAQKPGADPLPTVHSAKFAPIPEPTLRTGIRSMTTLALSLLPHKEK